MSYFGTCSDAKREIAEVELSESSRGNSNPSKILHGVSSPGGAANSAKPAGETMEPKRTKVKAATTSLKRNG